MESIYAALLLHKADKKLNQTNIGKVLTAAGVEVDKNQVKALVAGLDGKNIDDLIANAAAAPVAAAPAGGAAPAAKKGKKKKKEEKKEEPKDEEPAGLGALFG